MDATDAIREAGETLYWASFDLSNAATQPSIFIDIDITNETNTLNDILLALKKARVLQHAGLDVYPNAYPLLYNVLMLLPYFESIGMPSSIAFSNPQRHQKFIQDKQIKELTLYGNADRPFLADVCTFLQECPALEKVTMDVQNLRMEDIDAMTNYIAQNLLLESCRIRTLAGPVPEPFQWTAQQFEAMFQAFNANTHIESLQGFLTGTPFYEIIKLATLRNKQANILTKLATRTDVEIPPEILPVAELPAAIAAAPNLRILHVPRMPLPAAINDAICTNVTVGRIQVGTDYVGYQNPRVHAHLLQNQTRFSQTENEYWKYTTHATFPAATGLRLLTAMAASNHARLPRLPTETWAVIFNHLQRRDFSGTPDYFASDRRREQTRLEGNERRRIQDIATARRQAEYAAWHAARAAQQLKYSHWEDIVFKTKDGISTFYAIQCIHPSVEHMKALTSQHTNIRPVYVCVTSNPVTFSIVRGPQLDIGIFSTSKARQTMCEVISRDYLHGDARAKKELESVRCTSSEPLPENIELYIREIVSIWYQLHAFPQSFVIQ